MKRSLAVTLGIPVLVVVIGFSFSDRIEALLASILWTLFVGVIQLAEIADHVRAKARAPVDGV